MDVLFPFYKPDAESNIVYHQNVNKKEGFSAIKACTLPKIIEKLTLKYDSYFTSAFFLTYRDFTTPLEVVNLLSQRYNGPPVDGSKDHLRLFEIEVEVVRESVLMILKRLFGTLTAGDFRPGTSELNDAIQFFLNSLPEDEKSEYFMIYFNTKKSLRQPTDPNLNGNASQVGKGQITGSAASTMRFSFSVSPKTQSPSSTNGVLTGLLTNGNNSGHNGSGVTSPSTLSPSPESTVNTLTLNGASKSMKIGKGFMAKILQYNQQNSSSNSSSASTITNSTSINNLNTQMVDGNSTIGSTSSTGSNSSIKESPTVTPVATEDINQDDQTSLNGNGDGKPSFLPESIARELTIMEWELITALTVTEFTQKIYKDKNAAVNITNLTTWFNRISSWVTTKIISKETPEERATIIEAFITIATYAKDLKNYNCVMEILGSLHSSSISRLKNSWALISAKSNEAFSQLNQLMSSDFNFKNYRKLLSSIGQNEPCIPYLGLFLTDFLYLDESNPAFSGNPQQQMVNIERIFLIGTRVQEFFKLFNNCSYCFTTNPNVREAILSEKVWDENETFRLSRIREEQSVSSPNPIHLSLKESTSSGSSAVSGSTSTSSPLSSSVTSTLASSSSYPSSTARRKNFVTKYRMSFTGNDPPPSIAPNLTERDWKVLTTNSKVVKYKKDQRIINFGDVNHYLFRINSGRVKVEPFSVNKFNQMNASAQEENTNGLSKSSSQQFVDSLENQYLEEGEIFGEEAFLYEKPSMLTVHSDSDDLELVQIEKTFILQLFTTEPILSATFYKYIAVIMAERLKIIYANIHPGGSTAQSPSLSLPLISTSTPILSNSIIKGATSSPPNTRGGYDASKRRSTIYETPTSLDAIREGNDYKLRNTFGLSNKEEVIIKNYNCKHNNINGILYITKHHLCFEGKFLTIHKQKSIPFSQITKILPIADKNTLSITFKDKIKKYTFKLSEELTEVYGLVTKIWKNHHINHSSNNNSGNLTTSISASSSNSPNTTPILPPRSPKVGRGESFSNITDLPSKDEWNMILKGAKSVIFKKDDILMCEGVEYQKIFQIVRGECVIKKSTLSSTTSNGTPLSQSNDSIQPPSGAELPTPQQMVDSKNSVVLSKLNAGSIYGEMTFLLSGGCSTSLVANSDEVEVFVLESYFLNIIMKSKPALAPKFYKYLACVLESRVRQYRQQTLYI